MKKIFILILLGLFLFIPSSNVSALNEVNIYFFYSDNCKYCSQEKAYLEALKERYFNIRVYSYNVNGDSGNDLMKQAKKLYNIDESGVPFTIIGDTAFIGFSQSKKCSFEKEIYNYSYNKYDNKFGTQILTIGYSTELQGDVQKQYDESNYVVEEKGETTETTTVTTEKKSMSKKYSASIILAGIGVVCLICVLFISFIERKRRFI